MKRLLISAGLAALVLTACNQTPPAQKSRKVEDFSVRDLDGTWAWYGVENCWNNGNTIAFNHEHGKDFHIHVRYYDATVFDVQDATVAKAGAAAKPVMVVRYTLQNRQYEEQYQPVDVDTLRVIGSLVDGQPQQLSSINQPERKLVRCKDSDIRKQ